MNCTFTYIYIPTFILYNLVHNIVYNQIYCTACIGYLRCLTLSIIDCIKISPSVFSSLFLVLVIASTLWLLLNQYYLIITQHCEHTSKEYLAYWFSLSTIISIVTLILDTVMFVNFNVLECLNLIIYSYTLL